jgi:hypothetical protein
MNPLQIYAFIVLPLALAAVGYGSAWLFVRNAKRHDRLHPGE